MAEPILAVENVSKHFGGLRAVNAATLTVEQGPITAVIGPNGAGAAARLAGGAHGG